METTAPEIEKRIGGARLQTRHVALPLALALFAGLGCWLWWSLQPQALQTAHFRDGASLTLAAVTYGRVHQFDPAPPFFRLARTLRGPWPVPEPATLVTPEAETRVWLSTRLPPPSNRGNWVTFFALFEDEHGCPMDVGSSEWSAKMDRVVWNSLRPPEALRDGRPFFFRGVDLITQRDLYRFAVNLAKSRSAPRRRQSLHPKPLPQTTTTGELRATLKSVESVSLPNEPHYRARFEAVSARGAKLTPIAAYTEDQWGHRIRNPSAYVRKRLAGKGFAFHGLCRREPAWKLVATFAEEPSKSLKPDRVWDFSSLAVVLPMNPRNGVKKSGNRSLSVTSESLNSQVTTKTGKKVSLHGFTVSRPEQSHACRLVLTHIDGREAKKVFAELGDLGEHLTPWLAAELTAESKWETQFRVPVPDGAKSVRLRFAEYFGHTAAFVIQPPTSATTP